MEVTDSLTHALNRWHSIQPISEHDKHRLSQRFTVDFNFNSNHIEGNTLTYGQTELLLIFGKVTGEGELKDFEDMKASNVALKMMEVETLLQDIPLTQNFIRQLHKTLLREDYTVYRNLPGGEYTSYVIHAGQYKTRPNSVITRTGERFEYASPEETPALMTDLVDWYNAEEERGELTPVELAALFHYRYIRIHPFEDGNGRIARLLVNYILARHGYPMIVVRSRNKKEYLDALGASDKVVGKTPSKGAHASLQQIRHFLLYMAQLVATEINGDVDFITDVGNNIWWYDGQKVIVNDSTAKLLEAIMMDPTRTGERLSQDLNISRRAVMKQLNMLTTKGYIQRRLNGDFHVIIRSSVMS